MDQNIQRFQNWLHKYENVVLEGFVDFGRAPMTNVGARRNGGGGRLPALPYLGAGAQAKVAAVLVDHPWIQAPEIAQLAAIPSNRVQAILARMKTNGSLTTRGKRGRRTYSLKTKNAPAAAT